MNRTLIRFFTKRFALTCLGAVLTLTATAYSQEQRGAVPPSDRHSSGWDRTMRLKGTPLPPKFPKLGNEVERIVLENGMIVYLQEDHRLPLLDAVALVRTGSYYETPEEIGTAALVGDVLRTGGTKSYPPETLEERLDFISAELGVSMQTEECAVSLNVPKKDADEGLRILADVLRNPQFEESRLELAKQQTQFRLRSSNDNPGTLMRREFNRLMFTEAHPSGRTPTLERIAAIGRDDLVRFHGKYFHPNQVMLGVTGDFNKPELLAKLRELFGDWPKAEVSLPPLPKVNAEPKPGVYYVPKELNQTTIRLGHWGTNRDNPDRFAIDLMDSVLGGSGFSARLVKRVRNDEGLAYDVGSAFPTSQRDISFFIVVAQTKTESTGQAINSILDEIRKMAATRVSKDEFDTAKEMFLYSYVFRFAEPGRAMSALMNLEYDGLPVDYLEKEFQGYQAVTAEDIERVAKKYLHPDQLTIFAVGDYPKFSADVAKFGQPREITPLQFDGGNGRPGRRGPAGGGIR
jgi:predicted Zn-dependent peptidase